MDLKALVDYGYALEKSDRDSKSIENGRQNETINYNYRAPTKRKAARKNTSAPKASLIRTTPKQTQKISNELENACIMEDHFPTIEEEIHAQLVE